MAKIKPQTLKGFRDFLPEEMVIRQKVINTLKEVFESYGFQPLETPALEYAETLLGKYGEEADKLIYAFEDKGGRKVGLRYDLTVPVSRVLAQYQNQIPLPFKRYQIQRVWRADKPQAGRYREFLQCDIDIIGSSSFLSDAEIITCLLACIEKLGIKDYKLFINDRNFFKEQGIEEIKIIRALDKLPPLFKDEFPGNEIITILRDKASLSLEESEKKEREIENAPEPESIVKIKEFAKKMGADIDKIKFSPWLARGLDYYTGPIFELVARGTKNLSLGGGGRYDNLIAKLGGPNIPATGVSFGLDRICDVIKEQNLWPEVSPTSTKVLVTIFSPEFLEKSIETANKLRKAEIPTELFLDPETKIDKQLKYADKKGIPYVIILGPEEIKKGEVTLKNMKTGAQEKTSLENLIPKLTRVY
jgi:histidyl-tRNA synthetase